MAMKLLMCLFCCLALITDSHGYYRKSAIKRFMEELTREDEKDQECKSWEDETPVMCEMMVKMDEYYCEDHAKTPVVTSQCKRSCSACGPKQKAVAPIGKCENVRDDCQQLYHYFERQHKENPCVTQYAYSYSFCRKFCNLCQGPLGRPSKK